MELFDLALLSLLLAAFLAGAIDAVVGGGGLIQIPVLFMVFPEQSAATLFGTNKFSSIFGTASAGLRYLRQVSLPWRKRTFLLALARLPGQYHHQARG